MMNTWIYMEAVIAMPDVKVIHCDTRSFHIFLSDEQYDVKQLLDKMPDDPGNYMFARWEILGLLASLEVASGGRKNFRMFKISTVNGRVKYLHFVKYLDGYIACDRDYNPIRRKDLNADYVIPYCY